jgi:hypothetical protein
MIPVLERWILTSARLSEVLESLGQVLQILVRNGSRRREVAVDAKDIRLVRALYCFAVVTYMRCFTTGRRESLTIEEVRAVTPRDLALHEKIRRLRNKHFAHAVDDEEGATVLVVKKDAASRVVGFHIFSVVLASDTAPEVRRFMVLARKVARHASRNETVAGNALAAAVFGKGKRWKELLRVGEHITNSGGSFD